MTTLMQQAAHKLSIDSEGNRRDALGYVWQGLDTIFGGVPAIPSYQQPESEIPTAVTARQARRALNAIGLLDNIDAALATMPRDAQIEWQYAHEILRDSPLIAGVASRLGLGKAAIDALFTQASKL